MVTTLAAIPFAISQAFAEQKTAVWDGSSSANYGTAANWDINEVPLNNATDTFIVQIGASKTINYNVTNPNSIDELSFDVNSVFNLSSASLIFPTSLTVLDRAVLAGSINANNATFTAVGTGTSFLGNKVRLSATDGGVVKIAATDYSATGLVGTTLLSASGTDSLLDLSGLQSIDSGFTTGSNFAQTNTVAAALNASINLSGVKSITAPARTSDTLAFNVATGGNIDLSSLEQISGPATNTGRTAINVNNGTATLGPLQTVDRLFVTLSNDAIMTAGGSADVGTISNSTFSAAGGAKLNAQTWKADYNVSRLVGTTLLSASGTDSLLDLSGLQSIDSGFTTGSNFAQTNTVAATNSGVINLSGVKSFIAPDRASDALRISATAQGVINLSALQTITTGGRGQVTFDASTGGKLMIGSMTAGPRVHIALANDGSTLEAVDLDLLIGSTMSATAGTRVEIAGNFSFRQTVESQVDVDTAAFAFNGHGVQMLEIGSNNIGLPGQGVFVNNNFALGQLTVGQGSGATILELIDAIDNGNRSSPEALYLNGITDDDGLHILGGSTLVLNSFDLYTTESGQWVHVNNLFGTGVTKIAYDQGFISLVPVPIPEPSSWALFAAGLALLACRSRRVEGKMTDLLAA